jgi:hypothetical protein
MDTSQQCIYIQYLCIIAGDVARELEDTGLHPHNDGVDVTKLSHTMKVDGDARGQCSAVDKHTHNSRCCACVSVPAQWQATTYLRVHRSSQHGFESLLLSKYDVIIIAILLLDNGSIARRNAVHCGGICS